MHGLVIQSTWVLYVSLIGFNPRLLKAPQRDELSHGGLWSIRKLSFPFLFVCYDFVCC